MLQYGAQRPRLYAKNTRDIISRFADSDHFAFPYRKPKRSFKFIADEIITLTCIIVCVHFTPDDVRYNLIFKSLRLHDKL